jgi:hypothetical protein
MAGLLRIGSIPTATPITAYLTAACRSAYPNIRYRITSLSAEAIISHLDEYELDLGVTYLDDQVIEGFESLRMFEERYVLLAGRGAALEPGVAWEQAARLPLCLLTGKMRNRQIIDAAFRRAGAKPEVLLETDSLFSLYTHVTEAGLYSVMPHSLLKFFDMRSVQVHPLLPHVTRAIGMIARNRPSVAPITGAVLEIARSLGLQARFDSQLDGRPDPGDVQ